MGGICSPTLQDRKQKPFSLRVVGMPWAAGNTGSIIVLNPFQGGIFDRKT